MKEVGIQTFEYVGKGILGRGGSKCKGPEWDEVGLFGEW